CDALAKTKASRRFDPTGHKTIQLRLVGMCEVSSMAAVDHPLDQISVCGTPGPDQCGTPGPDQHGIWNYTDGIWRRGQRPHNYSNGRPREESLLRRTQ
ncbi:hypothetical protein JOQ06_028418, partial [Pogonophryne albipinna]